MDNKITSYDMDILTEIGNIGAGNAATALSTMLNQPIDLAVTQAVLCDLQDVPEHLGGAETLRTAVITKITKALDGYIYFIISDEDATSISKKAAGGYEIDPAMVLPEITNIITGAYIAAIADMIEEVVDQTPPQIGHDMVGALVDSVVAVLSSSGDKCLIIGTSLQIQGESISGFYVMFLESASLRKLLNKFNIDRL